MNAIATTSQPNALRPHTFADMSLLANAIAKSGLFGMKTPEQALVLMAIAQAEGRHPALAARDYDVIGGRPAKKSEAMLRDFIEAGGKVQWHTLSDDAADATFSHPAGGSVRINWNMERAAKAGLANKENYKKFARQMLRSRVVSEGVRTVYPLATSGLYVPEEAGDIPPGPVFAGPTLEATPEPQQATGQATQPLPPKRQSIGAYLSGLEAECRAARTPEAAQAILERSEIVNSAWVPASGRGRFDDALADMQNRVWPASPSPPRGEEDGDYTDAETAKVMGTA